MPTYPVAPPDAPRDKSRGRSTVYLRHATITKNGKTHTYWRLVRSVRMGSRVRQETVAHLGDLGARGRKKAQALARHFLGDRADQRDLFDDDGEEIEPRRVQLKAVALENARGFGDVWLGWVLWRALKLDEFCAAHLRSGREHVSWSSVAAILVIARLCEPSSELHIAEDWYRRTALCDIIGVDPSAVHHRRLYEGLDQLLEKKRDLEAHLKQRFGELFDLEYDILLYDVTSTYFEGLALANRLAKHGYSRDRRSDCKQVCIGLVVTRDGFPLAHEIFEGSRTDVTTVQEIVTAMETRFGKPRRVWVMDRGMISKENLEWLRAGERQYVLATPRSDLKKWQRQIVEREGWKDVREGLALKLCASDDGKEAFLLCRSEDRRIKEHATHERFRRRIKERLASLGRRLKYAKSPVPLGATERQVGRILSDNSRSARYLKVDVVKDKRRRSGLRLVLKSNAEWATWADASEGAYLLRSNVAGWTPEEFWKTYVQLSDAEAAFRANKSDLRIRPIWHHGADRVSAHILVCFLAFALWKTLQGWQQRAGLGSSPRHVLEELARIQSADVVLPFVEGGEARLRCVVRPNKSQAALLDRLGIELPRRLRTRQGAPV